uniref:Uncharacterized protein n=1 Tax=viral metagenome TaxID=1070528 RepID=A0A6C0DF38_9ZZZZ
METHTIETHPACLKDNEEYIIEKKYNDDNIFVYKGIRKVTSLDIINSEGLYEKLHFVNLELLSKKQNMDNMPKLEPGELKRTTHIRPEYSDILEHLGSSFDIEDDVKFYENNNLNFNNLEKMEK